MSATSTRDPLPKPLGNLIGGTWRLPRDPNGEITLLSPADLTETVGRFPYAYSAVEEAVAAARGAQRAWARLGEPARADLLRKFRAAVQAREAELSQVIAREVGKPLWEARGEVQAVLNKVDITLKESLPLVAEREIPDVQPGTTGRYRFRPLGVMAVIGPFNFPAHLPNGHLVPALATGNVVVFKPSEKAPLTGQLLAQCFIDAGFPPGVVNLVQGEKEVGRRLCAHEGVDGVLFTGSYEVGTRIKQDTLHQHWKLLALEMGGKNPTIVWKDADLDLAVRETLASAYLSCGQRCSATSRAIVERSLVEPFLEKLHAAAKGFKIGHPLEDPFMGPLIDAPSVDRYLKYLGIAAREGAELVMRGKALDVGLQGHYVTPSICWLPKADVEASRKSVYQQTELFGPNVAVLAVSELEEAVAQANATQFGLVASVFTRDRATFERCREDLAFGLVNWNKPTVGASSRLPFGGLKKSGNHFPTALTSPYYCTTPVSSLELPEPGAPTSYPGL